MTAVAPGSGGAVFRSLWSRFLVLLLAVSLLGLSASFYLRQMMLADFKQYLDGEMLDRVYLVTASIEGSYEQWSGWNESHLDREAIRALMMGVVVRVLDNSGRELADTAGAVENLTPLMKRRVLSLVDMNTRTPSGDFMPYPLFLGGEKIGTLMVRLFPRERADIFAERSSRFLMIAFLILGGLAVFASIVLSRKLTSPIKRLEEQTRSIREGNFMGRVGLSGIDEIDKLSGAFNEMADDLQLQESLRRKLIANVAHELRTPLAAMRGELEGMIDGVLPTGDEQIRSLYEETGRLRTMLDGIDDLTQAQASSMTLERREVRVADFLTNLGGRYGARAREKGVRIEVDAAEQAVVWADPDRLSQIVINLLENALRATPSGGSVTLRSGESVSGAFLEVADTGKGIEEEELPHLFERFYAGPDGGLGLGLAIVKELVDAHGGEIGIESGKGEGTIVRVVLPGR